MADELKVAASSLVGSLRELLTVFELQGRGIEAARNQAQAVEGQLTAMLEAQRAETDADRLRALREQRRETVRRLAASGSPQPELQESESLSARWEAGFCDAFHALMRLYAFPEARAGAERVAEFVRAVRIVQVEEAQVAPPAFEPPDFLSTEEAGEAGPLATGVDRVRKAAWELRFMANMKQHHDRLMEQMNEKIARTERLLHEALAEAEALDRSMSSH